LLLAQSLTLAVVYVQSKTWREVEVEVEVELMSFGRVAFLCTLRADPIEVLSAVAFVLFGS
jgi:hypothetical protein